MLPSLAIRQGSGGHRIDPKDNIGRSELQQDRWPENLAALEDIASLDAVINLRRKEPNARPALVAR